MKKVLVFGGSGLIGSRLVHLFKNEFYVTSPSRDQVDLEDKVMLKNFIINSTSEIIIYSAGLTSKEICERNPNRANILNTVVPGIIAENMSARTKMIYFSTDAVFDGICESPYKEFDTPNPLGVYGKTKLQGEHVVLAASNNNIVLRLITVYSPFYNRRLDFPRSVVNKLSKGEKINGIVDQYLNPTFIDDVCRSTKMLIDSDSRGLFHIGAVNSKSNYEIAVGIAEVFGLPKRLVLKTTYNDFKKNNNYPIRQYCSLSVDKFRSEFGAEYLNTIEDGIKMLHDNLNQND